MQLSLDGHGGSEAGQGIRTTVMREECMLASVVVVLDKKTTQNET